MLPSITSVWVSSVSWWVRWERSGRVNNNLGDGRGSSYVAGGVDEAQRRYRS